MKLRIQAQTVNVDAVAWALEYGIELKDVRNDVNMYFAHIVQELIDDLGLQGEQIK
jgi:putative Mn2+ efflux pump MntP